MGMLNPYQQYARNQVTTATPEELTHMLYKGAVKFITLAIKAIDERNLEESHKNIIKAQNIYRELISSLDQKYPISKNLASLYEYVIDLLIRANVKKDTELLNEALTMSKEFVETWAEAIKVYRSTQTAKVGQLG